MADLSSAAEASTFNAIPSSELFAPYLRNIIGQKIGLLTVISRAGSRGNSSLWLCRCDCGKEKLVSRIGLRAGTRSCGCLRFAAAKRRLPPGESAKRYVVIAYRHAARRRGLTWALSDSEAMALMLGNCYYCGSAPRLVCSVSRNGSFLRNGIDRVDNKDGYEPYNCVSCCHACNAAKRGMSYAEFSTWIRTVAAHLLAHPDAEAERLAANNAMSG
jgi:hypothetical protein